MFKCRSLQLLISVFLAASLVLLGISNVGASSSSPATWVELYGGALDDKAAAIVQTGDGGYAIAGTTYSFGAGSADFWLIKLDASGNGEWDQTYGGLKSDVAVAMVQTSDGGYALAGETYSSGAGESDFWLVKVDSSGKLQWNKTYGEQTADKATSVIQTSDGGYALVGYSIENGTNTDTLFIKTDSSGNMQWNRTYGGPGGGRAYSIIQTSDGGYALAGTTSSPTHYGESDFWLAKTNSNGNMEWNKAYTEQKTDNAQSVIQTSDGGYTLAGFATQAIIDAPDVWVINVDSSGNPKWNLTWVPGEPTMTNSVIQTSDGGYAVSGRTTTFGGLFGFSSYMFLIKVDSDGNIQWNSTYEGLGDNIDLFAVQTDDGSYALAGTTRSTDEGAHYDIWFAKVDASGVYIPEFLSWTPILVIFVVLAVALVVYKQKLKVTSCNFGA